MFSIKFRVNQVAHKTNSVYNYCYFPAITAECVRLRVETIFFNCYFAATRPTLGHYWGGSLTPPSPLCVIIKGDSFAPILWAIIEGAVSPPFHPPLPLDVNVNHCAFAYSTLRSPGASWRGWVTKPGWAPSGVWTGNLPILITTP